MQLPILRVTYLSFRKPCPYVVKLGPSSFHTHNLVLVNGSGLCSYTEVKFPRYATSYTGTNAYKK